MEKKKKIKTSQEEQKEKELRQNYDELQEAYNIALGEINKLRRKLKLQ